MEVKISYFHCSKLKDMYGLHLNVIDHFYNNVISKHLNHFILKKNFSDLYILYGRKSETDLGSVVQLNKRQYNFMEKHREMIFAYMLVDDREKDWHYIELFDTVVRKNNLGNRMIREYEDQIEILLIPRYIINTSVMYWAKHLKFLSDERKDYIDEDKINEYFEDYGLNPKKIQWDELYKLPSIQKLKKYS